MSFENLLVRTVVLLLSYPALPFPWGFLRHWAILWGDVVFVLALYIIHPNRASPTNCEAEPSFTLYVPPTHAGMLHVHDVTGTVPVHAPVNGSSLKCYLVHNESTEYAVSFTSLGRSVVAAR